MDIDNSTPKSVEKITHPPHVSGTPTIAELRRRVSMRKAQAQKSRNNKKQRIQ
jgi:hypothetical protein